MTGIRLIALAASALVGMAGLAQAAGDPAAGEAIVKKCAACHGPTSTGKKAKLPLAGMDVEAHIKAMQEYRDGTRTHKMMQKLAKQLSEQEIADLAAYYSNMK